MKFSLAAQIEEVKREIEMRGHVYPGLVASRKMKGGEADYHTKRMLAVLKTLEWLQRNEARVRSAIGPDDQA